MFQNIKHKPERNFIQNIYLVLGNERISNLYFDLELEKLSFKKSKEGISTRRLEITDCNTTISFTKTDWLVTLDDIYTTYLSKRAKCSNKVDCWIIHEKCEISKYLPYATNFGIL